MITTKPIQTSTEKENLQRRDESSYLKKRYPNKQQQSEMEEWKKIIPFDITKEPMEESDNEDVVKVFRDALDKKVFLQARSYLDTNFPNYPQLTYTMDSLSRNPEDFEYPDWLRKDRFSMNLTKIIFSKYLSKPSKKVECKEFIQKILKMDDDEFLTSYKNTYEELNKRSDEYRKQILGHFLNYLEREFYEREVGIGGDRMQIFDKRVAFLKFYRKRELKEEKYPSFNTLEEWHKNIFISNNKASLDYLRYLFEQFPEIRYRLMSFFDKFMKSKLRRRTGDIMRSIQGLFVSNSIKDISGDVDFEKIGMSIIFNQKFKFAWTDLLYKKALVHFKEKVYILFLETLGARKCKFETLKDKFRRIKKEAHKSYKKKWENCTDQDLLKKINNEVLEARNSLEIGEIKFLTIEECVSAISKIFKKKWKKMETRLAVIIKENTNVSEHSTEVLKELEEFTYSFEKLTRHLEQIKFYSEIYLEALGINKKKAGCVLFVDAIRQIECQGIVVEGEIKGFSYNKDLSVERRFSVIEGEGDDLSIFLFFLFFIRSIC